MDELLADNPGPDSNLVTWIWLGDSASHYTKEVPWTRYKALSYFLSRLSQTAANKPLWVDEGLGEWLG